MGMYRQQGGKTGACITVFQNRVLVQNNAEIKSPMIYAGYPKYEYHESKMPLILQEYDSRVRFRNI